MKLQIKAIDIELSRKEALELFEALETLRDDYQDIYKKIENKSLEKLRIIVKRTITTKTKIKEIKDIKLINN